jgi:hypothetical protein
VHFAHRSDPAAFHLRFLGSARRSLPLRHAPFAKVRPNGLKDLLSQPLLLEQVPEAQDRGLIRDPFREQINTGIAAHGGYLNHGLLHRRITTRVTLLQEMYM